MTPASINNITALLRNIVMDLAMPPRNQNGELIATRSAVLNDSLLAKYAISLVATYQFAAAEKEKLSASKHAHNTNAIENKQSAAQEVDIEKELIPLREAVKNFYLKNQDAEVDMAVAAKLLKQFEHFLKNVQQVIDNQVTRGGAPNTFIVSIRDAVLGLQDNLREAINPTMAHSSKASAKQPIDASQISISVR